MLEQEAIKKHPIRVAARYTALSADRIRTWEKRYKTVSPGRDKKGRRLYSDQDIERLTLLKQVSEFGRRISEVVHLPVNKLKELLREDSLKESTVRQIETRPSTGAVMKYFDVCFDAIKGMDTKMFYSNFLLAYKGLGATFLVEELLSPLIRHVLEECRHGNLQNVHAQVCKEIMHACLLLLYPQGKPLGTEPRMVTCSLEQDHELVGWRSAVTAGMCGWNPVYLGAMVDVDDIRDAVRMSGACAVVIGFSGDNEHFQTPNQLRHLKVSLPAKAALIINLPKTSSYRFTVKEINATEVHHLYELRYILNKLAVK